MSKDYKRRAVPPSPPQAKPLGFLWFFSGILIGAFFIGLAWLKFNPQLLTGDAVTNQVSSEQQQQPPVPNKASTAKAAEATSPASGLKFEFPNMLRDATVDVPAHNDAAQGNATTAASAQAPVPNPPPVVPRYQPQRPEPPQIQSQDTIAGPNTQPVVAPPTPEVDAIPVSVPKRQETKPVRPRTVDRIRPRVPVKPTKPAPKVVAVKPKSKPKPKPKPMVSEPAQPSAGNSKTAIRAKPPAKTGQKSVMLQLGAFQSEQDMRQVRARMALLGIETQSEKVTGKGGQIIHRLRTRSYNNQRELDDAKRVLGKHNVRNFVVK